MDTSAINSTEQTAHVFDQLLRNRRATPHFRTEQVPDEVISKALKMACEAPSGYNFQPWRFLVLCSIEQRSRLRKAALNQEKITEAPVMIVAFGQREGWKTYMDDIVRMRSERTGRAPDDPEKLKAHATRFVDSLSPAVWLNRQVMIAFTYLMLAFESLGWDTAPMEGFDGPAVKTTLELPADAEVIALLAVGRALDSNTPHPGRLDVSKICFRENCRHPFVS